MQGGRAGDAYGFTIKSLSKLKDTKANKPRMSLLHYLAQVRIMGEQTGTYTLRLRDHAHT